MKIIVDLENEGDVRKALILMGAGGALVVTEAVAEAAAAKPATKPAAKKPTAAEKKAAAKAGAESAATAEAETTEDAGDGIDRETVRAALKAYAALEGKEAAVKILKDHGSDTIGDLEEDQFEAVLKAAE